MGSWVSNQTLLPIPDESHSWRWKCCLVSQQSLAFRQQECGMSGVGVRKQGKNAKYVHVYPGLALHSAPSDVLQRSACIKGAPLSSQNSDQLLLPKLNSSFHQERKGPAVSRAAD